MKDNPKLPARNYYRLSQAAEELDCSPEYLIHIASLGKVKLITTPPGNLLYRVRAIQWERGVKSFTILDWLMLRLEFVELSAAPLRLVERFGELKFSNIEDEWPKEDGYLHHLLSESDALPPSTQHITVMIDVSLPSHEGEDGSWEPPPDGERTGFTVTSDYLWVPGEEVERLKRGEPARPTKEIPPEIAAQIYQDPAPKSRNSYLRTIAALGQALLGKELTQPHKDAYAILQAIGAAGIEEPVKEDALANYLKAAGEVERKPKG